MAKRDSDFELERRLLGPREGDGDGGSSVPVGLRCPVRAGFVGPRTPPLPRQVRSAAPSAARAQTLVPSSVAELRCAVSRRSLPSASLILATAVSDGAAARRLQAWALFLGPRCRWLLRRRCRSKAIPLSRSNGSLSLFIFFWKGSRGPFSRSHSFTKKYFGFCLKSFGGAGFVAVAQEELAFLGKQDGEKPAIRSRMNGKKLTSVLSRRMNKKTKVRVLGAGIL